MSIELLPFNHILISGQVLLTNQVGEYLFVEEESFRKIMNGDFSEKEVIEKLKTRQFLVEKDKLHESREILNVKYNTKHSYLHKESLLLMVVPTIQCNCNCVYCQVTSKKAYSESNDMTLRSILDFCDFACSLPYKYIKIEFQGGEPTLRFDIVEFIINRIKMVQRKTATVFSYVICTNLVFLTNHQIAFLKRNNVSVSTSLDGDKRIHEQNRLSLNEGSTYTAFIDNLRRLRKKGIEPSPLATITSFSILRIREIIDQYISLGFKSIFIRPLNYYGLAYSNPRISYSTDLYLKYYDIAIDYIIDLNKKGISFQEEFATIILRKILSPFNDGFVDMQDPSAIGTMCLIVNQKGDIYPSDEARMLAEMGDEYWKVSNVSNHDRLERIEEEINEIQNNSLLAKIPECSSCAFIPYCTNDPIRDRENSSNIASSRCGYKRGTFIIIFRKLLENEGTTMSIFRRWANGQPE